jgi:hypothetical protein
MRFPATKSISVGEGHVPINGNAYRLGTGRLLKSDYSRCSNGYSPCSNGNGSAIASTIAASAQFYRCSNGSTLATST